MAILTCVSFVLMLVVMAGCRTGPEQWGPFRGRVVDADTDQPIGGAHVMVLWIREPPSLHYAQWFYDAQETVTNEDGRFEIPRETRVLTGWVRGPDVHLFAPGYLMLTPETTPADGRPYVDPTVVRMRPLRTREEQCKYEPLGVTLAAHASVPNFVNAQRDYRRTLQCSEVR